MARISLEIEQEALYKHQYFHLMDNVLRMPECFLVEGETDLSVEGVLLFVRSKLEWTKVQQLGAIRALILEAQKQVLGV